MQLTHFAATLCTLLLFTSTATAELPPLPSATNGDGIAANNGMKHLNIGFDGSSLTVHADTTLVTMMRGDGIDYTPSQFDVIEGQYFNSQYGWLFDGIVVLPTDSAVNIRRINQTTPAGASLHAYEGGMGMGMDMWTMNELYANDGDLWTWDGLMQHDMYVADLPGEYSMTYEVYLADITTGAQLTAYGTATQTISFTTPVPEPASIALLLIAAAGLGSSLWTRRR